MSRYAPDQDKETGHICSCEIILLCLSWFIEGQPVNDWHSSTLHGVIVTSVHFDKSSLFLRLQAKWTQKTCACDII